MDRTLMLWLASGALAVLTMMLVVVRIARRLDRDSSAQRAAIEKLLGVASRMKGGAGIAAAATGPVIALLAQTSTQKDAEDEEPTDPRTVRMRAFVTGIALAGGILALLVGILTDKS